MSSTPVRLLSAFIVLLLAALPARAAVFNVTTPGEFQAALTAAVGNGQDDTINVAAGTYDVSTTLTHSDTDISRSLDIVGAGAATTILDGGGAVQVMNLRCDGNIGVSGLTIRNGNINDGGGGLYAWPSGGTFSLSDSILSGNNAGNEGGGLLTICAVATVSNSRFVGNSSAWDGGGAYILGDDITITDSTFSDNTMGHNNRGGGLLVDSFGAGALAFSGNTVSGNAATGTCDGSEEDEGVGMYVNIKGPVELTRNLIDNNATPCVGRGAGVYLGSGGLPTDISVVADNIFSRNSSGPGTTRPLIQYAGLPRLDLTNNTFSGNDSGEAAVADVRITAFDDTTALNISNNIFYGDGGTDSLEIRNDIDGNAVFSPTTFRNNLIDPAALTLTPGGGVTESGSFFADPLFADPAKGDFHISAFSPAVDMGLATAPGIQAVDFDGDARALGSAPDVGADESLSRSVRFATYNPVDGTVSIPDLRFGGTKLQAAKAAKVYEIRLTRLAETGYVFELTQFGKIGTTKNPAATYNTATGRLDIPAVKVAGLKATYHVTMQKRKGQFVFDVTSARKN